MTSTPTTRRVKRSPPLVCGKIRHILVPTDFSAVAGRALRYAAPLARRFGAAMALLHVVRPLTYEADYGYGPVLRRVPDPEMIRCATRHLHSTARPTRTVCRRQTCLVRSGNVAEEIVRAARDLNTDLIVMGEGSIAANKTEEMKTVAEKTLRSAPCPVLIVGESGAQLLKRRKT
jgi:universal stress protein A